MSRHDLAALAAADDQAIDLIDCALALACRHQGGWDHARVEAILAELTAQVAEAVDGLDSAAGQAQALSDCLIGTRGWRVARDEAADAELPSLLLDGAGGAEILAVVWVWVARQAGLSCDCLAFPHHPLVRLADQAGQRVILDCASGLVLSTPSLRALHKTDAGPAAELAPDFFTALSNRALLLRWRQALKLRALRLGQLEAALALVDSALAFAPRHIALWRESGLMRLRLNDMAGAAAALEQFIQRADPGPARVRTQQLLADIRARMT